MSSILFVFIFLLAQVPQCIMERPPNKFSAHEPSALVSSWNSSLHNPGANSRILYMGDWPSTWPVLSRMPWPGTVTEYANASFIAVKYQDPGRDCMWLGQKYAFQDAWEKIMYDWSWSPAPRYRAVFENPVLHVRFRGDTAWTSGQRWNKRAFWKLARATMDHALRETFLRGCKSYTAGTWVVWEDHTVTPLGTLQLLIKEPPSYDRNDLWQSPTEFPIRRHIKGETGPGSQMVFLDTQGGRRAWSADTTDNSFIPWTTVDPVRRRWVLDLLTACLRKIALMSDGATDPRGFNFYGFKCSSSPARFKIEVSSRSGQVPWSKLLALNVFDTLKDLVSRHGVIGCVIEVQKAGGTVGFVRLMAAFGHGSSGWRES